MAFCKNPTGRNTYATCTKPGKNAWEEKHTRLMIRTIILNFWSKFLDR